MAHPGSSTNDRQAQVAHALKQLMVTHGVGSIRPRGSSGFLGMTRQGTFETKDLAFQFMSPEEHYAAAHALGLHARQLKISDKAKGPQDMERFVRAAGGVFDQYSILNLEFTREALLGFRKTGHTVDFVVEGITLTLR